MSYPPFTLCLLDSSSFPFLTLRQTIFQLGASCLPHLILLLLLAQFFCGFSPKGNSIRLAQERKGIQLAGCSRETLRLDSTLEFAGEFNKHLTDWLGVRAPCSSLPCLVLADFLICNTPGRCLSFRGRAQLDPHRLQNASLIC